LFMDKAMPAKDLGPKQLYIITTRYGYLWHTPNGKWCWTHVKNAMQALRVHEGITTPAQKKEGRFVIHEVFDWDKWKGKNE